MIPHIDVTTLPDHLEKQGYLIDERAFLTADGRYCLSFYNIREVHLCHLSRRRREPSTLRAPAGCEPRPV